MNRDTTPFDFDMMSLHHLADAAHDPDVVIHSFETELEKISSWNPLNWAASAMGGVRSGARNIGAAWHGIDPTEYGKLVDFSNMNKFRQSLKLSPLAEPGAAGAAGAVGAAGAAAPSFFNTHFGMDQLSAPAGSAPGAGISNWWKNTSDMQKLKTMGAAGLGLGAAGVGANMMMNRNRPPQINMGPTVTGY